MPELAVTLEQSTARAEARIPPLLLLTSVLALLAKCSMAFFTYGTLDVTTFRNDVAVAKSEGVTVLYREGIHYLVHGQPYAAQIFSHPPSMIHVLRLWDLLEGSSGLPLQFWMRFFCALADFGTVLVVWRLSLLKPGFMIDRKALILMAACPISIMVSGFHGNTDPIMMFFLVASVYFVEADKPAIAGLFFGLAACVKIVPILFALCFVLRIGTVRVVVRFAVIGAATFFIAGLPYWAYTWREALHVFATYDSRPWLATLVFRSLGISAGMHRIVFVLLAIALSIYMNIRPKRVPLFIQVGAVTMLFLAIAPGFAIQYFVWGVPWVVSLGAMNAAIYYAFAGAFLARLYTIWCKGLPWYAADDISSTLGAAGTILLVLSWLAVWYTCFVFVRRIVGHRDNRDPDLRTVRPSLRRNPGYSEPDCQRRLCPFQTQKHTTLATIHRFRLRMVQRCFGARNSPPTADSGGRLCFLDANSSLQPRCGSLRFD